MASRKDRGTLIVGLVAAMAILAILSTVAVEAWIDVLRRDNEAEMIFRAQEISRALRRFQKDQGRLPIKLDELLEAGNRGQYFIRRLYDDPLVKDGKWGLLYAAPGGGLLDPNAPGMEAGTVLGGASESSNPGNPLGGLSSRFGEGPRQAEGMPIAGVKSLSTERPFRVYRDSSDYSQWLFSIFDLEPRQAGGQNAPGGGTTPGGGGAAPPGRPGARQPGGAGR